MAGYTDLTRLNTEIPKLCIQLSSILVPQIVSPVLRDMLENMEVLQVCLGEIEGSLVDQRDNLPALQEGALCINNMLKELRLSAKEGSSKPTLQISEASLKGSLNVYPGRVQGDAKDQIGTVSGKQAFSSGKLSWSVKILDVQRRSIGFGSTSMIPNETNSLSLLLGVTSNPTTATSDCHYDPNCIVFSLHDRQLFQGKRKEDANGPQAAVPARTASPYESSRHFSNGEVFVVYLDCDARQLSISCKSWPSAISTRLPAGSSWYPHFCSLNTSFYVELVDS